jgi:hypothetical protein
MIREIIRKRICPFIGIGGNFLLIHKYIFDFGLICVWSLVSVSIAPSTNSCGRKAWEEQMRYEDIAI